MGVLSRLNTLIKSNLNELIARAEDPEKILEQSIIDMRESFQQAKKEVVESLAQQKVIEKRHEGAAQEASSWEQKAIAAIEGGDDELAREALRRKVSVDQRASGLAEQRDTQREYVDTLRASLSALEQKIEEAKAKKGELVTRLRAAKVKEDMIAAREVAMGVHKALEDNTAFAAFARMEEKILHIEGRVEAMAEMSGAVTGALPDAAQDLQIEEKLRALKASSAVEDELSALKRRLSEKSGA